MPENEIVWPMGTTDRNLSDRPDVYTSQEILADHDLYAAQRSVPRRVVGALTDDQATIALYWMSARELAARSRCRTRPGC